MKNNKKILLVVDYQNDFVIGSLGFENAVSLDEKIAKRVREAKENDYDVIFTFDTHDEDYLTTQEGNRLPVPHCVDGSDGHDIYGLTKLESLGCMRIKKVTFGSISLSDFLRNLSNIKEIEICGVVTNMCVISNAVICKTVLPEAKIIVNAELCASFNDSLHEQALNVMESMQMDVINRKGNM